MLDIHVQTGPTVIEVLIPGPQGPGGGGSDEIGGYAVVIDHLENDHVIAFNGTNWHNKPLMSGGDMTKAVYDSKNDGKVNVARLAEAVSWSGITSAPASFPPSSHTHVIAEVTGLAMALGDKAPLASPALTGTPIAPTASAGTNTTQIATTAFVTSAVAAILPGGITWADITGKPASFLPSAHTHVIADVTGLSTALGDKAPLASPVLTGTPTAPTASAGTNTAQLATTAFVTTAATKNAAVITTSGNFTVPAGITKLLVHLWGAGGGGGGSGSANSMAGGGGGGAYCFGVLTVTPGQIIAATVGAAGSAGAGGGYGSNGGSTTFATLAAGGGEGGPSNPSGAYNSALGGTASGGSLNLSAGHGGLGQMNGYGGHGGGGGGSPFGGSGGTPSTFAGTVGVVPGGGGAGAGGSGVNGGAGAPGLIIINY